MLAIGAFLLKHIEGVVGILAIALLVGALWAAKHSYDNGKRDEGRAEVRAEIRKDCGEAAKSAADCIAAGKESVRIEYSTKIDTANATIRAQDEALKTATAATATLKADAERRQKAAAQALAAAQAQAKSSAQQITKIETAKPTGATPCESACALLRSSW